jgi:hypothetical protein
MIIDLTITNFRSIKSQQTLSLYAEHPGNHLSTNISYPDSGKYGVLRSAAIYGANASGKSNLLLAIAALRYLACFTGDLKDGDPIPCYEPFLLDEQCKRAPTSFEIEFFLKDVRFQYKISFNQTKVLFESLDFYPATHKANLFTRDGNKSWKEVKFGNHLKGGKRKFAFFDNNSYLSKSGNNADSPEIIRSVFNYLRQSLVSIDSTRRHYVENWANDPEFVSQVAKILTLIDTGISGIKFEEKENFDMAFPQDFPEEVKNRIIERNKMETFFLHDSKDGNSVKFPLKLESLGTQRLFQVLPLLVKTFQEGRVLIWDEIERSLHPHVAEVIIKLFNDPSTNTKNGQLIFTTHNIQLMSPELLRRDQIWFTEKRDGTTTLSSLDEFKKSSVRADSPYGKWYDEGRFGAIPHIDKREISQILRGQ